MEELKNKIVVGTTYASSIPQLYPMVGLGKDQGSFPVMNENRAIDRSQGLENHRDGVKVQRDKNMNSSNEHIIQTGYNYICKRNDLKYSDSDPESVLATASVFFCANCYDKVLQVLGVLDLHLMLPEKCHMAKEFGCGLVNQKLGKWKNAKSYFNTLTELASSFNSTGNSALASQFLGEVEMTCGNFASAEKHFSSAVRGFTFNTVAVVFNIEPSKSALYLKLGQCQKALQKTKDSVSSMSKAIECAKNKEELLEANTNMGHAYMNLHDYKQCLHYHQESLKLSVELGDQKSEGLSHGNIGCVLLHLNEMISALEHLTIAYHFSARYECNSLAVGRAVTNLAHGYAAIDDISKALEYFKIARDHFIYARDSQAEGRACGNIGNMYMMLKDYNKAIEYYDEALTLLRDVSSKEAACHNRCLAKFEVAIANEDYANALVLAEETRARTVSKSILKKATAINFNLSTTSNLMTSTGIYKTVAMVKVPVVFTSYCKSKLLIWVMVPIKDDVKMKCCLIHLNDFGDSSFEQFIHCKLLDVGFNLFDPPNDEQKEAFAKLYDTVGKEIEESFEDLGADNVSEFIFIPDNVTYLLPLPGMLNKQKSEIFGDRYRIRIYPSILSLQMLNTIHTDTVVEISRNERDCLVVGNPKIPPFIHDNVQSNLGRLPFAEAEAKLVSSILSTTPLMGTHATKQGVLYRMRNAKIIHIATHGSGSAGFLAFSSSFPLCKDGYAKSKEILIQCSDIETLKISAALVVLSSCQANRNSGNSDSVMGIAGAFISAGAQCVLVSSFNVADESTVVFMELFYQFLVDGFSATHALQKSTQSMRCMRKFCGYNHWAGFQIIGNDISISQKTSHDPVMLGTNQLSKTSIFSREAVEDIKHSLQNNSTNKVQLLMGLSGSEPEECAKDYIKKYYYLYPCGVYWLSGRDDLMLEISTALANIVCDKQSSDDGQKKLIVIDDIKTNVQVNHLIDNKTDIIMISNDTFDEDNILRHIEDAYSRSVNVISIRNLTTSEVMKNLTYSLLKRRTFSPQDIHLQFFDELNQLTMTTVSLCNFVVTLFKKYSIEELSIKVNQCINLLMIEKERRKNSSNTLLTCKKLIQSFVSPEAQMLLDTLSIVGSHNIPIPSFIIKEAEELMISNSSKLKSSFKELEDFLIICKYPYPCMHRNKERITDLSDQRIEFYYIPKLICSAMLEQTEETEILLNALSLLKAIEVNVAKYTCDKIKLQLMFEILTILCKHSTNNELSSNYINLKMKIAYNLHYSNVIL